MAKERDDGYGCDPFYFPKTTFKYTKIIRKEKVAVTFSDGVFGVLRTAEIENFPEHENLSCVFSTIFRKKYSSEKLIVITVTGI